MATKRSVVPVISIERARTALAAAIKRDRDRRNKAFRRLSDGEKRVTIAGDVLDQLDAKRFVPTFGTYLEVPFSVETKFYDGNLKVDEVLSGVTCEVCGIGSLFVAAVDRANACTVDDMQSPSDDEFMREYLGEWFSREQLEMIEAAFEGRQIWILGFSSIKDSFKKCVRFTSRVKSPEGRLRKIMRNIVENKGVFVP